MHKQAQHTFRHFSIVFSASISCKIPANLDHNLDLLICSRLSTQLFSDQNAKYEVYTSILCSCYWIVSLGCHCITWYSVEKRKQTNFRCHDWDSNPQPPDCHVLIKQHLEVWGRWLTQKIQKKKTTTKNGYHQKQRDRSLKTSFYIFLHRDTGQLLWYCQGLQNLRSF